MTPSRILGGTQATAPEARWRPLPLAAGNLIAAVLFLTWLLEPTRSLWLALDDWAFWSMNNSLAEGKLWQQFWAVANNRAFDLVAALSMMLLFAHRALIKDREHLLRYIAIGIFMTLSVVLVLQFGKWIPVERPCGTIVYPEALRLTELVPHIDTKDLSDDSFPGDHGLVLLLCAGFILYNLPRAYGLLALVFMVIFTIPRLMSGAHWLSDELVGAVGLGCLSLSWILATPLHDRVVYWLETKLQRFRKYRAERKQG
jgi:membrane-associated phospholipid phosphatase